MMIQMKKLILLFVLLIICEDIYSQVGINVEEPHPSAVLQIQRKKDSDAIGVLLPKISNNERTEEKNGNYATSLIAYDSVARKIVIYDADNKTWKILNVWEQSFKLDDNEIPADITTSHGVSINNTLTANEVKVKDTLSAKVVQGEYTVPKGGIIIWSGAIDDIPEGWLLCDGSEIPNGNGKRTPDLRGRFIVGYDSNSPTTPKNASNKVINYGSVGNTGGDNDVLLTANQSGLPSHAHEIIDPGHIHKYEDESRDNGNAGGNLDQRGGRQRLPIPIKETRNATTNISILNNIERDALESHENRPPYFVMAFIMKL
jgi:microcystin-dependent protein